MAVVILGGLLFFPLSLPTHKISNLVILCGILLVVILSFPYHTYAQHTSLSKPGKLNLQAIKDVLDIKGTEKDGEYKVTVPQNDLNVQVDGFKIIPPMEAPQKKHQFEVILPCL